MIPLDDDSLIALECAKVAPVSRRERSVKIAPTDGRCAFYKLKVLRAEEHAYEAADEVGGPPCDAIDADVLLDQNVAIGARWPCLQRQRKRERPFGALHLGGNAGDRPS